MRKTPKRPKHAMTITAYAELTRYVEAWCDRALSLVILVGGPGTQKTRMVRDAVGPGPVGWITGNCTGFGLYLKAYEYRNQPLVIDDVDDLYGSNNAVRILKNLCQTERVKRVGWTNFMTAMDSSGVPAEFTTTSSVMIIANEWATFNDNIAAVEDRGHVLFFEPTALELHHRTAEWFVDQEVFDFIGENLHIISRPSMRDYVRAMELKNAGMDWRKALLHQWLPNEAARIAAQLIADRSFESEEERVQAFIASGGGSRATYFGRKKNLQPPQASMSRILLRNGCGRSV